MMLFDQLLSTLCDGTMGVIILLINRSVAGLCIQLCICQSTTLVRLEIYAGNWSDSFGWLGAWCVVYA